jgi:hypothetical protein
MYEALHIADCLKNLVAKVAIGWTVTKAKNLRLQNAAQFTIYSGNIRYRVTVTKETI